MSEPHYQGISSERIPIADLGSGSFARVVAGELDGARGPARTFTPMNVFDLRLGGSSPVQLRLPSGHNAGLVLLHGDVVVNRSAALAGEAKLALLNADGDSVLLESKAPSVLLVLSGEPIDEPVASYGPFVMNTREELKQAIDDYNAGKMGHLR
jgi:hypothetical protein